MIATAQAPEVRGGVEVFVRRHDEALGARGDLLCREWRYANGECPIAC